MFFFTKLWSNDVTLWTGRTPTLFSLQKNSTILWNNYFTLEWILLIRSRVLKRALQIQFCTESYIKHSLTDPMNRLKSLFWFFWIHKLDQNDPLPFVESILKKDFKKSKYFMKFHIIINSIPTFHSKLLCSHT